MGKEVVGEMKMLGSGCNLDCADVPHFRRSCAAGGSGGNLQRLASALCCHRSFGEGGGEYI